MMADRQTRQDNYPSGSLGAPEDRRNEEERLRRGEAGSEVTTRPEARPAGVPGETVSAQAEGPPPAAVLRGDERPPADSPATPEAAEEPGGTGAAELAAPDDLGESRLTRDEHGTTPEGNTAAGGVSGQWEAATPARVGQGGPQDAGDIQNLPRPVDPVASAPDDLEKLNAGLADDTARQAADVGKPEAGPGPGKSE